MQDNRRARIIPQIVVVGDRARWLIVFPEGNNDLFGYLHV